MVVLLAEVFDGAVGVTEAVGDETTKVVPRVGRLVFDEFLRVSKELLREAGLGAVGLNFDVHPLLGVGQPHCQINPAAVRARLEVVALCEGEVARVAEPREENALNVSLPTERGMDVSDLW